MRHHLAPLQRHVSTGVGPAGRVAVEFEGFETGGTATIERLTHTIAAAQIVSLTIDDDFLIQARDQHMPSAWSHQIGNEHTVVATRAHACNSAGGVAAQAV